MQCYPDIGDFDSNGTGTDNGNYFGFPFTPEQSQLVLLSVPWDVTASYNEGARFGPDAIIGASTQLDLYDPLYPDAWRKGIGTIGIEYSIQDRSQFLRDDAVKVMKHLENGGKPTDDYVSKRADKINEASAEMNDYVYRTSSEWLDKGKIVGLVGGDHSTPYGLLRALAAREQSFSVLHVDAHADLRQQYEGFEFSHASIMHNVATRISEVEHLVQVGIRDLCDFEAEFAEENPKLRMVTDYELSAGRFTGKSWDDQCAEIINSLSNRVYISFDIDGLSPDNAPHTGTPVPGGLSFNEAVWLINKIATTGRKVIGFDLCEVAPKVDNEWDGNVGARILYKLCNLALSTQGDR